MVPESTDMMSPLDVDSVYGAPEYYPSVDLSQFVNQFEQHMKSEKLQRRYKKMLKTDVATLQDAFKVLYGIDTWGNKGHFCQ